MRLGFGIWLELIGNCQEWLMSSGKVEERERTRISRLRC